MALTIMASYGWFIFKGGNARALLWDSAKEWRNESSATRRMAYAINDRRQVVGESNDHAFIWQDGKMRPGHGIMRRSRARAINESGQGSGVQTMRTF